MQSVTTIGLDTVLSPAAMVRYRVTVRWVVPNRVR